MNKISQKKIEENAATILASNPKQPEVFMTSNAQGYWDEDIAENRQANLDGSKKVQKFKRGLKVETTEEVETTAFDGILEKNVNDLKVALKEIKDPVILKELLAVEKASTARKTALEAIQLQLDEISKDQ